MPTPEFSDPRQVVIYDAVNSYEPGTQSDFYLGLAEEVSAETVVDLGCGTGIITLEFASRSYRVIGVDPSPVMLEVALQKPGADAVEWVQGGAGQLGNPGADLVIMSGHVAQFILKDDDWLEALVGVNEALRPGGYLAFESRDPRAREWKRWIGRKRTIPDSPYGPIESWTEVTSVDAVLFTRSAIDVSCRVMRNWFHPSPFGSAAKSCSDSLSPRLGSPSSMSLVTGIGDRRVRTSGS